MEPWFNEPLYNKVLSITNDFLQPAQNYCKLYWTKPRSNKILVITNTICKSKRKMYLNIHLFQLRLLRRRMIHDAWSMFHSARCITGASAVCNMPAPYSENLRWRAIWIRHFCGYSEEETCFRLGISKWTLRRYLHGYFVSGDVKAKKIGKPLGSLHFQPPEELIIMEAVLENATVSLNEIFDQIYRSTGSEFALSSLHYYFQRNGITRKKVILIFAFHLRGLNCLILA